MVNSSSMFRLSLAGGILLALCGCATVDEAGAAKAAGAKTTTAVPSSYRQLVARYVAANTRYKLIKAEISRPGEGWMGLFDGGNRPIVCANLTIQGPLIQQGYTLGFTFENGQIAKVFSPGGYNPMIGAVGAALQDALTCGQLSYGPFPEAMTSKAK